MFKHWCHCAFLLLTPLQQLPPVLPPTMFPSVFSLVFMPHCHVYIHTELNLNSL